MLDEVEEGRLGPLQVVEVDNERLDRRLLLQDLAEGELSLGRRATDGVLGIAAELEQYLDNRPVRDAIAVMQTTAAQHARAFSDRVHESANEPRLAHSRGAEQREHVARAIVHGLLEVPEQPLELALAPNHRPVETTCERRRIGIDHEDSVGLDRLALSLQLERLGRLGLDRVTHETEGLAPDQRLPGRRSLLESGSDIHGVAGHERLALASDDFAGVDADPNLELERRSSRLHLRSRPHCTQRVVLVGLRDAEDGHDGVADELLHGAAVPFDDRPHLLVVAPHQPPQGLRIDALAERRRADDVAEEHCDGLPHFACA